MSVTFDFDGRAVLVTGACGALGSAVCEAFDAAGASVHATDVIDVESEDSLLDPDLAEFHRGDLTDEADVERVVEAVVDSAGRLDYLANVAGTWAGGQPIDETDVSEFEMLMNVNCKSAFLASKHALSHLRETEGAIVSVSARASLEGGKGDGPYRMSKAGIRLLTETLAAENKGTVRANCVMPSVIDTPANREMMDPKDEWVNPAAIAEVFLVLCSDATEPTSGAAIPVYGEA
ncbi:3-phenylpropionate-dihydrodiol/cinnamic acid-dihydrodiol dehydrogenase [Halalkalicoccus paucihalophilus]|uniref:3-phenylpropionate-dihydrodiol/cinnamic acid-dihydrodiol dehydrogenase n=1 Tax=Halalkalicoccus paucihalophilus TaxID=1008153 RepID=A0A151AG56_9EURY|nr:SDR family NAD(P)-dependent oxidoreductase [Halalkalicoccus paucihalophilus]KYH26575.1 3-phenylpropionate-dihydrodiol/cinnamic acid-dihydrodiol dehydrogenase [Halalkalicoccus paucihalophilus]